jgi:replicative DNA helicase
MLTAKMPPQATDLENAIIGACMLEPQALEQVVEIITTPEAFYTEANRAIYTAMLDMYQLGTTIDMMTIGAELKKRGLLDMVGGHYAVGKYVENVANSAHIEEHSRIVMEKFMCRELIKFHANAVAKAYDDTNDAFELVDEMGGFLLTLTDSVIKKPYYHVRNSVQAVIEQASQLMNREISMVGVPTGYREMNRLTGGWKRTDLIILAARPSVGKTAMLLNLAINAVTDTQNPTPVGIFSLEMNHQQLTERMLANVADLPLSNIQNGNLSQGEFEHLSKVAGTASTLPIYVDDTASLTTIELKAKARRMKRVHNVGLIIIDYLQLMKGTEKTQSREQEISKISRELKLLAKTLEIPIIALSQLNRSVESRTDTEPKLSDLRDSGAIEQDADIVCFLFGNSKELIKENPYRANERFMSFAKHRNGRLATFQFDFNGSRQRFENEKMLTQDAEFTEIAPERHENTKITRTLPPSQLSLPGEDLPF